jgi:hypothetical protein
MRRFTNEEKNVAKDVQLRPEEEKRLRSLLERCDALGNAYDAVLVEDVPNTGVKTKTLATLQEIKEEAEESFSRYKREVGIAD